MTDFSKEQIVAILDAADEVKRAVLNPQYDREFQQKHGRSVNNLLQGIHVATLFLENSTRTNYSFRTAGMKTGGSVDGFPSKVYTSLEKGETWADTVAMFAGWGYDAIVMRSKVEGLPRWTKEALTKTHQHLASQHQEFQHAFPQKVPLVINGGDGKNPPPTQCLLDLFTIREIARKHGKQLDGLHISLLNDLAHGRTNASLMSVAHLFNFTLHFAYPQRFGPQKRRLASLERHGVETHDHKQDFIAAMRSSFIAYHSRPQKERVGKGEDLITIKQIGQINRAMYDQLGEDAPYLMHPLPVDAEMFEEISHDMDSHPKNVTKFQSANGLYVRIALLAVGLGRMKSSLNGVGLQNTKTPVRVDELSSSVKEKVLENPRSGYIKNTGVVLDHIPIGMGRRLEGVLGFEHERPPLVSAYNIPVVGGKKPGKDMTKIHSTYNFSTQQLEAISLIAPDATISVVENGIVTRKFRPVIGNYIEGRVRCGNKACVTNVEKENVKPKHTIDAARVLTCLYCEETDTVDQVYAETRFIYI